MWIIMPKFAPDLRKISAGTTTMSDLLNAQSSYQQSRDKYVDAYIGYQQNLLKYRQATGQ